MGTTRHIRVDDTTVSAEIGPAGEVTIDDVRYSVEEIRRGLYRVADGERRWTVAVSRAADTGWISIDGQVAQFESEANSSRPRKKRSLGPGALASPMPATVVSLPVPPGTAVRQGDTLIVLEAMKMELPVR
ncbi:MAG: hypothetical protein LC791_18965, partial [Acidobacteria bacterium]|nr:hypothetical protein [Acidobacteriota bacterium]